MTVDAQAVLPRSFRIARGVLAFFLLLTLGPLLFDFGAFFGQDLGYAEMALFFLNGPLAFAVLLSSASLGSAATRAAPEHARVARLWQWAALALTLAGPALLWLGHALGFKESGC